MNEFTELKGLLFDFPAQDQEKIKVLINQIKDIIKSDEALGLMALAYVSLEMQEKLNKT